MTTTDSLPSVAEKTSLVDTTHFLSEEASLPDFRLKDLHLLTRPNSNIANHTQDLHFNGDSSAFAIRPIPLPVPPPSLPPANKYFTALQKWEGYVIEVGSDTFRARLIPIVGEGPDLEAEIYLEEVDLNDRVLIEPGSVFYWSIGYLDGPSGRARHSVIRFRRLPARTKREMDAINVEVAKLKELINAE